MKGISSCSSEDCTPEAAAAGDDEEEEEEKEEEEDDDDDEKLTPTTLWDTPRALSHVINVESELPPASNMRVQRVSARPINEI